MKLLVEEYACALLVTNVGFNRVCLPFGGSGEYQR